MLLIFSLRLVQQMLQIRAGGLRFQGVRPRRRTGTAAASVLEPTVPLQTRLKQAEQPVGMPAKGNAALLPSAAALLTRLSSYCYQHAPYPGRRSKSPWNQM